jgi:ElaB/YqjD/DUF883 family membrane-anchored ribosome-binding protein
VTPEEDMTETNLNDTLKETAKKADTAIRDTAQTYITKAGMKLDLKQVEAKIGDKPIPALAIAAAAGFIVGGGLATRIGVAILALFGRKAASETAGNFVTGMTRYHSR